MTSTLKVAAVVGSLRRDSFNRKLVNALSRLAPPSLSITVVEIGELPLFNQDDELSPSIAVVEFRQRILAADAVMFATPEYNRSIPGPLKNAIDTGSRPYGHNVWDKKPAAIISVSPGAMGAFGANHALRQPLVFLNMPTMPQPEAYLGGAEKLFDERGEFAIASTRQFCATYLSRFEDWIRQQLD